VSRSGKICKWHYRAPRKQATNPRPLLDPCTGEHVLGLEPGTVRLREYTPLWAELFLIEAADLHAGLGVLALDVEHVGSTAVPGLAAKPVLDIAVAIAAHSLVPRCATLLARLGYQYAYWADLDNDYTFEKGVEPHASRASRRARQPAVEQLPSVPGHPAGERRARARIRANQSGAGREILQRSSLVHAREGRVHPACAVSHLNGPGLERR
jgi:GrpB-like predicted nucleotidyltransferase (UPF0157 family)